jgi:Polysaccharide lyase
VAAAALVLATLSAPPDATAKRKHKPNHKSQGPALLFSDTGVATDAASLWGKVDCQSESRAQQITTGGDTHPTAMGAPQGDSAFRRLSVLDGDDIYGERCELGWDNRRSPTALYRQGRHRLTELSVRLPSLFPLSVSTWQAVMQMKQSGPSNNSSGTPMLELDAYAGRWHLRQSLSRGPASDSRELWSTAAQVNFWTRFAFDVRYSDRKKRGYIRVGADLNGDGDFADAGELSKGFHTYTLKVETPGGSADGIKAGSAIPSHLRVGMYHDTAIPCRAPSGCQVDIDNVQVIRP